MNSEQICHMTRIASEASRHKVHLNCPADRVVFERHTQFDPSFSVYLPCHIVSAARYEVKNGLKLTSRGCGLYDLIYLYAGAMAYRQGQINYSVKRGEALFVSHAVRWELCQTEPCDFLILRSHGFLCDSFYQLVEGGRPHPTDVSRSKDILSLFDSVYFCMQYPTTANNARITSAMTRIYTDIYNCDLGISESDGKYGHPKWFGDVIEYIEKNYRRPVKVSRLAEIAGLSESYFYHIFHDYTGATPYQYINEVRIGHARPMITGTDMQMKAIAREVGFPSCGHFIECFKKITGMTPGQYRLAGGLAGDVSPVGRDGARS